MSDSTTTDPASVWIRYRNYRGEVAWRHIRPYSIRFASSAFHPGEQWLLYAMDLGRQAPRSFALADVLAWSRERPGEPGGDTTS